MPEIGDVIEPREIEKAVLAHTNSQDGALDFGWGLDLFNSSNNGAYTERRVLQSGVHKEKPNVKKITDK